MRPEARLPPYYSVRLASPDICPHKTTPRDRTN